MAKVYAVIFALHILNLFCQSDAQTRECISTGPTCLEDCAGQADGNYQWCGQCYHYLACSNGVGTLMPCPGSLYWNDIQKACASASSTCVVCAVWMTKDPDATNPPSLPINPPDIEDQCGGYNGIRCIDDCTQTLNGIFQWCSRCDYYAACNGGDLQPMPCSPGLVWDDVLRRCDFTSMTCDCDATAPASDHLKLQKRFNQNLNQAYL